MAKKKTKARPKAKPKTKAKAKPKTKAKAKPKTKTKAKSKPKSKPKSKVIVNSKNMRITAQSTEPISECDLKKSNCSPCDSGGFVYFLGVIGALIYYISTATGFWSGVLGVLKAIVWPAFLVHALLKFLGM